MFQEIFSIEEFEKFKNDNLSSAFYFSTRDCNVWKVLKPKIKEMIDNDFPNIKIAYVDCEDSKELAAANNVFAVPTILFFFDGKEFLRKSRNISLPELENEIDRLYSLFYK